MRVDVLSARIFCPALTCAIQLPSRSSMGRGRAHVRCAVSGCENNKPGSAKDVSFFIVPKDARRRAWLKAIKKKYTKPMKLLVCELHFNNEDIVINNARKRVVWSALPVRNLPTDDEDSTDTMAQPNSDKEIQVPEMKSEPSEDENGPILDLLTVEETVIAMKRSMSTETLLLDDIPVKRERSEDQEDFSTAMDEMNDFMEPLPIIPDETIRPSTSMSTSTPDTLDLLIKLTKSYLSPELAKLVEVQTLMKKELQTAFLGNKFNKGVILFALKLYHSFPQTYKLMQESLYLPSVLKIKQLCRNLTWEIDDTWMKVMQARFESASLNQRECVVCVARVPLQLQLSYDPIRDRMVGLNEIDGVQKPQSVQHATVVYARGIFSRWQQPLSCAMLAHNTRPEEVRIWLDVILSKLFDVGLNVRAVITDFDDNFTPTIRPPGGDKTYIQIKDKQIYCFYDCTQLLVTFRNCFIKNNINFRGMMASWDVIEELYDYDSTRRYKLAPALTEEHVRPSRHGERRADLAVQTLSTQVASALATAVDLRVLDDSTHGTIQLITTFNTLYNILHSKELTATENKITPVMKFLNEMLMNFERINFVDNDDNRSLAEPGVLRAFRADVRAVLALQERYRLAGQPTLPLRAFNNDLIRQLYDRVRDNSAKPTARQLVDGFRRSFVFNIMKSFSEPEGKLEKFLEGATGIRDVAVESIEDSIEPLVKGLVKPAHFTSLLMTQPTPPMARFLLAQCASKQPCCEIGLNYCKALPTKPFIDFLSVMERKFRSYYSAQSLNEGTLWSLLDAVTDGQFSPPCPCFPILYLKTLYMRFRIANLVQFNNNKFKKNVSRYFTMNILHH